MPYQAPFLAAPGIGRVMSAEGYNRVVALRRCPADVDYPAQARLKILGRVDVLEGEPAQSWMDRVRLSGYKAVIERVFVIHVEAFDWNCPQHITPRYTADEIEDVVRALEERLHALERENAALRDREGLSSTGAQR